MITKEEALRAAREGQEEALKDLDPALERYREYLRKDLEVLQDPANQEEYLEQVPSFYEAKLAILSFSHGYIQGFARGMMRELQKF